MALRTKEQLELLFQQRREINERKRERELKKQKERQERLKRFKDERLPTIFKKTQPVQNKQPQRQIKCSFSITIYQSNLIERETAEEDLYQTREELMEAEDRGEGAINWELWDKLVNINKTPSGSGR